MRTFSALVLVAVVCALAPAQGVDGPRRGTRQDVAVFNPAAQQPVGATAHGWTVLVSMRPGAKPSEEPSLAATASDSETGKSHNIPLGRYTLQADSVAIGNPSRAVVLGSANSTVRTVSVLDLQAGSLLDQFLCYFPRVSGDGQLVAFVKFTPRSSSERGDVYCVYDVRLSPEANRVKGTPRGEWREFAGLPVFPPENVQGGTYASGTGPESPDHMLVEGGLSWAGRRTLMLFDRTADEVTATVTVFGNQPGRWQTQSASVPVESLFDPACAKRASVSPAALLRIAVLRPTASGNIEVSFQPADCLREKTVTLVRQADRTLAVRTGAGTRRP